VSHARLEVVDSTLTPGQIRFLADPTTSLGPVLVKALLPPRDAPLEFSGEVGHVRATLTLSNSVVV
jgi:hypothetical protein